MLAGVALSVLLEDEIHFLAYRTIRAGPVIGNLQPAGARRKAFIFLATAFVVDVTAVGALKLVRGIEILFRLTGSRHGTLCHIRFRVGAVIGDRRLLPFFLRC